MSGKGQQGCLNVASASLEEEEGKGETHQSRTIRSSCGAGDVRLWRDTPYW